MNVCVLLSNLWLVIVGTYYGYKHIHGAQMFGSGVAYNTNYKDSFQKSPRIWVKHKTTLLFILKDLRFGRHPVDWSLKSWRFLLTQHDQFSQGASSTGFTQRSVHFVGQCSQISWFSVLLKVFFCPNQFKLCMCTSRRIKNYFMTIQPYMIII